ncbi:alpha/beta hydrolase [Flagellimonas myxillae]|uniref:alpha/beta hydrolase n=1 Tax=Flagellimonas myxillae TaxID=2942214 RepID=UPI00201F85EB|nr:alpha/beta hydrolase [Muricauda myxillae]MCL6266102.1 lysophospholipase [Muricauda myxillae]
MSVRFLLFTILLLAPTMGLFGQLRQEPAVLPTESGDIQGSLLIPQGIENPEVVLIIAGSGPTDRNGNFPNGVNNSLKLLAEGLYQNKIATLRYDKRGIGESTTAGMAESELRFEHYVNDAVAWAKWLQKDGRFGKLTILGHSEGSLIGMIASKEVNANRFVSVAGPGIPAGELIRTQLKEQPPAILEMANPILDSLENGKSVQEVPQMLSMLFRSSVQPYMISWFRYNPQNEIAKLNCPVLIVQGTTDMQVSETDAEKLHEAFPNAQKVLIQEMNHVLKPASSNKMQNLMTYSNPDLPLADGLLEVLTDFIQD